MRRFDDIEAVVVANGEYPAAQEPLQVVKDAPYVVCCDGGADRYIELGNRPDLIIGDGDSLSSENRTRFADIVLRDADQETNDQTKAVKYLLANGRRRIAIVGATGKREDHTIGNISLLVEYMRQGAEGRIYTDYGVFIPCEGECRFECSKGAAVSIFNVSAKDLHSEGLVYPIYDFTAWWQGTLNKSAESHFTISAQGEYVVFISYR